MTKPSANILYGAKISYFTGKVRVYFNYKNIPFEERQADLKVYQELIVPRVGWPVIPVVVTPEDEILQDTSDIIDHFEALHPRPPVYPEGAVQRFVALLIELWADEWLKLPAMHYRWNHNLDFILGEFGRLSRPDLDADERREVGRKTSQQFAGSLPILGVNEATIPEIEKSYEALLLELQQHFESCEFLLGSQPTIADFGLYGPLYAHLYLDPASGALMQRLAPAVTAWVERMTDGAPNSQALASEDAIPDTLMPVLARICAEYLPVLKHAVSTLQAWLQDNSDATEVPRMLGMSEFQLGGVHSERGVFTFDQWMLQRAMDHYSGLNTADQKRIEQLLTSIGGSDLFAISIEHRVKRQNFKLVAQRT